MKLSESDSFIYRFDLLGADVGVLELQREGPVTISRPTRRPTDQAPCGRTGGPTGGRRGPVHDEVVRGFHADMEGVSEWFPEVSEGFQGFRQSNRRREMLKNVRRCQNPGSEAEGDGRGSRPLF